MSTLAYIGLGANLGDAASSLEQAAQELSCSNGIQQLTLSPRYRSTPVESSGPDYVNAVAAVQTTLSAKQLLSLLLSIEQQHGRERPWHNAPRTLDLDLLLFGSATLTEPDLIVPHPRMHLRAFVLRPLADLAPDLLLKQGDLPTLLATCSDQALSPL
ncbi:2-amino-4-hydroxy-6-hydroxymethyldihydropteridine diphosphokinase [Alcaligenaceae bacterium]|nr:2-amino-4-hydroxy-6-hydroxymethyldihydropteridine diphosphokinase [Alcaligenaceae bacterium]